MVSLTINLGPWSVTHVHVQITSKNSPEDSFESSHPGTIDSSRNEPTKAILRQYKDTVAMKKRTHSRSNPA